MNLIKLNDWPINKFVEVIIFTQILFTLSFFISSFNIAFGVLQGATGFILLTFIPGFIILRIFKLHMLDTIKTVLFALGLSLSFITILGILLSLISPFLRILPFSPNTLVFILNISLLILLLISYFKDNDFTYSTQRIDLNDILNPYVLFSFILVFLSITSIYYINDFGNNILLIFFILVFSLSIIVYSYYNIPKKAYPLIIFSMSLAILFQVTLFSNYVVGTDIFGEVSIATLTANNGFWNYSVINTLNSALSVSLLPAMYTSICSFDITSFFKILSPILFSFVPVGLYYIYSTNFVGLNRKENFLATLAVIVGFYFFGIMTGIVRQELAEIFFILLLIMILDGIEDKREMFFFVIFSIMLILFHYTLAIIFLFFLIGFLIFNSIVPHLFRVKINLKKKYIISYFIFFLISMVLYFYLTSSGAVLRIYGVSAIIAFYSLFSIFSPDTNFILGVSNSTPINFLHMIYSYFNYFMVFCAFLGLLIRLIISFKKPDENIDYQSDRYLKYQLLTITVSILLFLYLIIPMISYQVGFERIFLIIFMLLSPFFILGFKNLLSIPYKVSKMFKYELKIFDKFSIVLIAIFLSSFFIFSSGLIYELTGDSLPNSVSLSLKENNYPEELDKKQGLLLLKVRVVDQSEFYGAKWLSTFRTQNKTIYTSFGAPELQLNGIISPLSNVSSVNGLDTLNESSFAGYLYLNSIYTIFGMELVKRHRWDNGIIESVSENETNQLMKLNKIYSNKKVDIFYK